MKQGSAIAYLQNRISVYRSVSCVIGQLSCQCHSNFQNRHVTKGGQVIHWRRQCPEGFLLVKGRHWPLLNFKSPTLQLQLSKTEEEKDPSERCRRPLITLLRLAASGEAAAAVVAVAMMARNLWRRKMNFPSTSWSGWNDATVRQVLLHRIFRGCEKWAFFSTLQNCVIFAGEFSQFQVRRLLGQGERASEPQNPRRTGQRGEAAGALLPAGWGFRAVAVSSSQILSRNVGSAQDEARGD